MIDRDLIKRIQEEGRPLNAADEAAIDRALEMDSPSAFLVGQLPEEQLSLAWRSRLNERVALLAGKAKRKARWIIWRPALGLGIASALALAFMVRMPMSPGPGQAAPPAVEEGLLLAHETSVQGTEIAGAGLAQHEAIPVAAHSEADLFDWSEVDVETL